MKKNKEISILNIHTDIIEKGISPKLSLQDLSRLVRTSKEINSLFKKSLIDAKLTRLLKHVAFGEQEKAERILKLEPTLLLMKGKVTDHSGRTFNDITAFQYAVWALDWHMWKMIRKYLPKAADQEQARGFSEGSWVAEHGEHVNWKQLTDAQQTLLDNWNSWDRKKSIEYWAQQVGSAQLLLPMHILQEYFQPNRPFSPCPNFATEYVLVRGVPDSDIGAYGSQYGYHFNACFSELGKGLGILRGDFVIGCSWDARVDHGGYTPGGWSQLHALGSRLGCVWDRPALLELFNTRTQQRSELVKTLEDDLKAEKRLHNHIVEQINQQQASSINAKEKAREFYNNGKTAFHSGDKSKAITFFLQAKDNYKDVLANPGADPRSKTEAEKKLNNIKNPNGKYSLKKLTQT